MFNVSARVVIIHKAEKQASKFLTLGCVYTSVVKDEFSITWYVVEKKITETELFELRSKCLLVSIQGLSSLVTFRGRGACLTSPPELIKTSPVLCYVLAAAPVWTSIHLNPGPPGFCCLPWYDPFVIHAAGLAGWAILQAHLPTSFCSWTSYHDIGGKRLLFFK